MLLTASPSTMDRLRRPTGRRPPDRFRRVDADSCRRSPASGYHQLHLSRRSPDTPNTGRRPARSRPHDFSIVSARGRRLRISQRVHTVDLSHHTAPGGLSPGRKFVNLDGGREGGIAQRSRAGLATLLWIRPPGGPDGAMRRRSGVATLVMRGQGRLGPAGRCRRDGRRSGRPRGTPARR
jgi:hypothetical protein